MKYQALAVSLTGASLSSAGAQNQSGRFLFDVAKPAAKFRPTHALQLLHTISADSATILRGK